MKNVCRNEKIKFNQKEKTKLVSFDQQDYVGAQYTSEFCVCLVLRLRLPAGFFRENACVYKIHIRKASPPVPILI